ncbi:MAG: transporter substrate-binding domain-containing protein [Erysipelotrichaceae bacterium]|nr:transporter substrate-binding domain-containing protein [Erysipelotrichaceae bacterium]
MKKLLKGLMVTALAFTMCACSSSNDDSTSDTEVVTITVAVSPDYAPYESLDTDGETIVGFDADMVALFPSYINTDDTTYVFEWYNMSFENIVTQIQAGQADIGVSGFTYDESRKVAWSEPYLGTAQVAVVAADSDIETVDDLKGKTIAAQSGATGEEAANAIEDANVVSVSNVQEIFTSLTSGQYDAVVVDSGVAQNYANAQGFKVLDEVLMDEKNYIIAKEGNDEMIELINTCIEQFLASDDYQELCDKWGLTPLED